MDFIFDHGKMSRMPKNSITHSPPQLNFRWWRTLINMIHVLLRLLFYTFQLNFRLFNDWLIAYGFTSRSIIFHLCRDITITGERMQNLGPWSALRAFEQWGIFIMPHLLWHGTFTFPVSSKGQPHLIASYDSQGDSNPDSHGWT
jgi:hypothetical protein